MDDINIDNTINAGVDTELMTHFCMCRYFTGGYTDIKK